MKKTLIYVVILGILGFGIWFFLFKEKSQFNAARTPSGVLDDAFQIKDTAAIGKIFLATRSGVTSTLVRKGAGWELDGAYPAAPFMVQQLLATMAEQEAKQPVIESQRDDVVKYMAGDGIKTEVYDLKGKLIKTFYVGGEASNYKGTFMLMEGGERPYVVQVPYFSGYVTPRYQPGQKTWRDRQMLFANRTDIVSVGMDYPGKPENSFVVYKVNDSTVNVTAAGSEGKELNKSNAITYLGFFDKLYAAALVNGDPDIDSVLSGVPLIGNLTLKTKDNKVQKASFYFMPLNSRSKNFTADSTDERNDYDADNAYAVYNDNKDTAVVQYLKFDRLFRKAAEFFTPAK